MINPIRRAINAFKEKAEREYAEELESVIGKHELPKIDKVEIARVPLSFLGLKEVDGRIERLDP